MVSGLRRNVMSPWQRRPDALAPVDGLRALSILWVVAYHAFVFVGRPLRHGPDEPLFRVANRGLLGVDVFFVISGFLIGTMLLREAEESGKVRLGRFYLRRAMRILPAYWVSLTVYCAMGEKNAGNVVWNLLFANNFLPENEQCMPWAWSLAIEEQFYVVFPLVVSLVPRRGRLGWLVGMWLAAIGIRAWLVVRHGLDVEGPDHARVYYDAIYDKTYGRFGELLSGVIAAHLWTFTDAKEVLRKSPRAAQVAFVASFGVIALLATARQPVFLYRWPPIGNLLYYAGSPALFSAAVAYVLFACLAGVAQPVARLLSWRALLPISHLSYSMYLTHVMIIQTALETEAFSPARTAPAMAAYLVVVPTVSIASAVSLYVLVEKPVMDLRRSTTHASA